MILLGKKMDHLSQMVIQFHLIMEGCNSTPAQKNQTNTKQTNKQGEVMLGLTLGFQYHVAGLLYIAMVTCALLQHRLGINRSKIPT